MQMFLVWAREKAVMLLWDNEASFAKFRNKSQTHKEQGCDYRTWVERDCDSEMLLLPFFPLTVSSSVSKTEAGWSLQPLLCFGLESDNSLVF